MPHLKFLPDPEYTHVYYVDFKPKVFDARIGDPLQRAGTPPGEPFLSVGSTWGVSTSGLEGEFNDGNGVSTRHFYPAYVCMDITDPLNPRVLWERTYTELGMTRATPSVIRIANGLNDTAYGFPMGNWYAVFGSGPTDYDGESSHMGMCSWWISRRVNLSDIPIIPPVTGDFPYRQG